jgi:hypothetical protein
MTTKRKITRAKTIASADGTVDIVATVKAMAALETAFADSSTEELLNILKDRFRAVGIAKYFEARGFGRSMGMTFITKQHQGGVMALRMTLGGNGFKPVNRTAKIRTFTRTTVNADGTQSEIDVTLVAGVPDVITVSVYTGPLSQ